MCKYHVRFIKHVTKYTMTYGIYDSFYEASKVIKDCKLINNIDEWYIEEVYSKGSNL